jgi:uncharacterized DUF497 family protein
MHNVHMNIEFDPKKASSNLKKHGVSFAEAASVLLDAMALVREDSDAEGEARFLVVGTSDAGHMLTVCYTLIGDEAIRLISARPATKNERRQYES